MEPKATKLTSLKNNLDINNKSEIKENIQGNTLNNSKQYEINSGKSNNNSHYVDKNLNFVSNLKKDEHKSMIDDNKLIKNLNSTNYSCNTTIKNRKRYSKNISKGIRNMLKILKLDDENLEDNISEEEIINHNKKRLSININNRKKNEDIITPNNQNNKQKEINNRQKASINNNSSLEINDKNMNNIEDNSINNSIKNNIAHKEIVLYENSKKNNNKTGFDILEISRNNNIEFKNKIVINRNIIEVEEINNINYISNNIKTSYLDKSFKVSNENMININKNNKENKHNEFIIEKNNFELKDNNKKAHSLKFENALNMASEVNISIEKMPIKNINEGKLKEEVKGNNSKIKIRNKNIIKDEIHLNILNKNNNISNNVSPLNSTINNINMEKKENNYKIKYINNFSINNCIIKDSKSNFQIKNPENFCIKKEENKLINPNNCINSFDKITNKNDCSFSTNDKSNLNFPHDYKEYEKNNKENIIINISDKKENENSKKKDKNNKITKNKKSVYSKININNLPSNDNSNQLKNISPYIKKKKYGLINPINKNENELGINQSLKTKENNINNKSFINNLNKKLNYRNKNELKYSSIKKNNRIFKKILNSSYIPPEEAKIVETNNSLCKFKYIKKKNSLPSLKGEKFKSNIYRKNKKLNKNGIYKLIGIISDSNYNNNIECKTSRPYLISKKMNRIKHNQDINNKFINNSNNNSQDFINISEIFKQNNNNIFDNSTEMCCNSINPCDIKSTSDESNNNININNKNISLNNLDSIRNSLNKKPKIKISSSVKECINNFINKKANLIAQQNNINNNANINESNKSSKSKNRKKSLEKNDIKNNYEILNNSSEEKKEEINEYNGPIDIKYISLKNYDITINALKKKIKKLKYNYVVINSNLFKCIKETKIMFIEVVKLKKGLYYYLITKDKKHLRNKKIIKEKQ